MPKHRFPHDASYKTFFSDPAIVKSLLLDFIPEDFMKGLDFSTLQQATGEYVTEDFQERHCDTIWRLRWEDGWCYIFLLIEFQSSQSRWMALRMLTYTALLWENLIKTGYLKAGDKLPPVFPIVLYNGDIPWTVERELSKLLPVVGEPLDAYQPTYRYYVVDEKRIPKEILKSANGGAAYIVKAEQAENKEQLFRVALEFDLEDKPAIAEATCLALLEWMDKKFKHLPPGGPENNLFEGDGENMLIEMLEKYKKPYIDEGYAQGKIAGEVLGMTAIIKEMLSQKFGSLAANWELSLLKLEKPDMIMKLYRELFKATTPGEVDEVLKNWL